MKITLEGPYANLYRSGYTTRHKDGRALVCLYNSNQDRTVTSFARYRMSVLLNRIIPPEFEVDHKNDNRLDDSDDNLQLLSPGDNKKKTPPKRTCKHGTISGYRYCKCELCCKAKSLYSAGKLEEYRLFVAALANI